MATHATRGQRLLQAAACVSLVAIILGLVGVINQDFIKTQYHRWSVERAYAAAPLWRGALPAAQERALKPGQPFRECAPRQPGKDDCPTMVVVPAGLFIMGSRLDVGIRKPPHKVTIIKPFAVSRYEVTFAECQACVAGGGCNGYTASDEFGWGKGARPVINVDWHDAQAYVAWLSEVTGKHYRLLSDAEYEYATRAGTTTVYPWGNDIKPNGKAMANCKGCGSRWDHKRTAPVGSFTAEGFVGTFPANAFGLHDMVGNVFEWTEDCWHYSYNGAPRDGSAWLKADGGDCTQRVVRGGDWGNAPDLSRSAYSIGFVTDDRYYDLGFRVARTLATQAGAITVAPSVR